MIQRVLSLLRLPALMLPLQSSFFCLPPGFSTFGLHSTDIVIRNRHFVAPQGRKDEDTAVQGEGRQEGQEEALGTASG